MFPINKNSYLQAHCSGVPPQLLNRALEQALNEPVISHFDEHDLSPSFNRLTSEQPYIPCQQVDVTRRRQGFGRCALVKLRRELHSNNHITVLRAVNSISDLVHDPEKNFEAICLLIPARLSDRLTHTNDCVRENTAICLTTMAQLLDGKMTIVQNNSILRHIEYAMSDGVEAVKMKVAVLLRTLSETWMAADYLVEADYISKILDRLQQDVDNVNKVHLETLKNLMYEKGKEIALYLNGFLIFKQLLDSKDYELVYRALDCLMILVTTKAGQKLALEHNLLTTAYNLLTHHKIEVVTSAVSVLVFCTIKTKAKIQAAELKELPRKLIKLMRDPCNETLQIYCIKALTNIIEHPEVRKYVYEKYGEILQNLQTRLEPHHKEIMWKVLTLQPWSKN